MCGLQQKQTVDGCRWRWNRKPQLSSCVSRVGEESESLQLSTVALCNLVSLRRSRRSSWISPSQSFSRRALTIEHRGVDWIFLLSKIATKCTWYCPQHTHFGEKKVHTHTLSYTAGSSSLTANRGMFKQSSLFYCIQCVTALLGALNTAGTIHTEYRPMMWYTDTTTLSLAAHRAERPKQITRVFIKEMEAFYAQMSTLQLWLVETVNMNFAH